MIIYELIWRKKDINNENLGSPVDHGECLSYEWNGHCLPCSSSPCAMCDGTSSCPRCFDEMQSGTRCDTCPHNNNMVVNGKCIDCLSIDAFLNRERNCECNRPGLLNHAAGNCCYRISGVFVDKNVCKACSKELIGCDACEASQSGVLRCTRCSKGYTRVFLGGASICVIETGSRGTYLGIAGTLILALLILL